METGLTKTGPEINSLGDIIMTSGDHTQMDKTRSSGGSESGRSIGASWLAHGTAVGCGSRRGKFTLDLAHIHSQLLGRFDNRFPVGGGVSLKDSNGPMAQDRSRLAYT